jgi:hypothetical protein
MKPQRSGMATCREALMLGGLAGGLAVAGPLPREIRRGLELTSVKFT